LYQRQFMIWQSWEIMAVFGCHRIWSNDLIILFDGFNFWPPPLPSCLSSKFFLVIECVFRIKQEIISCVTWCKSNMTTSCTSYCCMNISSFHDITWPVITSAVILHEMGKKITFKIFFILKYIKMLIYFYIVILKIWNWIFLKKHD
jgi:hypothetical protein